MGQIRNKEKCFINCYTAMFNRIDPNVGVIVIYTCLYHVGKNDEDYFRI